jgi:hypothetical protein
MQHTKGRAKAVSVTIDLIQRKFLQGTLWEFIFLTFDF